MKKVVLFLMCFLFLSCEKEYSSEESFTLIITNSWLYSQRLVIDNDVYDISNNKGPLIYNVSINCDSIYTIDKVFIIDSTGLTKGYWYTYINLIEERPNAGAKYYIVR